MNIDSWDIVPYTRVGPLTFDISQDEARNILGKEQLSYFDKIENETTLYWQENAIQLTFDDQGLSNVSFYPYTENIFIEGKLLDWNKTKPLFKRLLKDDPSARKGLGIFVLFKLGISVVDFDHHENDKKSMAIFRKGYWAENEHFLEKI